MSALQTQFFYPFRGGLSSFWPTPKEGYRPIAPISYTPLELGADQVDLWKDAGIRSKMRTRSNSTLALSLIDDAAPANDGKASELHRTRIWR